MKETLNRSQQLFKKMKEQKNDSKDEALSKDVVDVLDGIVGDVQEGLIDFKWEDEKQAKNALTYLKKEIGNITVFDFFQ